MQQRASPLATAPSRPNPGNLAAVQDILAAEPGAATRRGNGGACPLHMSGMSGAGQRRDVVEALVAAGAEVDAPDEWGYTPLMRTASNNLLEGWRGASHAPPSDRWLADLGRWGGWLPERPAPGVQGRAGKRALRGRACCWMAQPPDGATRC
jgi:hypothetical protein